MFRLSSDFWNKFARKTLRAVFSLALAASCVSGAFAYTTENFDVDVTVGEDNSYAFSESVTVNFDKQQHGIYVYVPTTGMSGVQTDKLQIHDQRDPEMDNEWVKDWNYEVYDDGDKRVFQIGDADTTVTGRQKYEFGYRMRIVDDKDTTKDFMYIDLLPTGWETAIDSTKIRVRMPKSIDEDEIQVYADAYGGEEVVTNVWWDYDEEENIITITGKNLEQGVGITVFCLLPEGYWVDQLNYDGVLSLIPILCIVIGAASLILWLIFGRDKKIIPTVEFYPPEGLNPAEVGLIVDGTADKSDLLSLIIYFADKGYLTIKQKDKKDFTLTKVKEIDTKEKKFARTLFDGLFAKGSSVNLKDLDEDFGDAYFAAYGALTGYYRKSKNRLFTISSKIWRVVVFVFAAVMPLLMTAFSSLYSGDFTSVLIGGFAGTLVIVVTLLLLLRAQDKIYVTNTGRKTAKFMILWIINLASVFVNALMIFLDTKSTVCALTFVAGLVAAEAAACMMEKRTDKSIDLMGKILGLRNFIETAEADRINLLVEENPSYFYEVLPYAYVLGVTDKWAKNFEKIHIETPSWYYGDNDALMDAWFYSTMMRSCSTTVAKNIHINTDAIDSGGGGGFSSGGGGFSGGGFGGGGGGAW